MYDTLRSPQEREVLPPETVIRNVLEWYADSSMEQEDTFFTLQSAWDALAYDKYETGSREEGLAGSLFTSVLWRDQRASHQIDQPQTGTPYLTQWPRPQAFLTNEDKTEITIPEKLRKYNQYLMSSEYEELWNKAKSQRNR